MRRAAKNLAQPSLAVIFAEKGLMDTGKGEGTERGRQRGKDPIFGSQLTRKQTAASCQSDFKDEKETLRGWLIWR